MTAFMPDVPDGRSLDETHITVAAGRPSPAGQPKDSAIPRLLPADRREPDDQNLIGTHSRDVVGHPFNDALLRVYADALDDIEATRIANQNRVRALRQAKGMDGTPEEQRLTGMVDALAVIERGVELELKRALRQHPLGPWVKRTVGVGEKQGARLLAAIGDPYWNTLHDRPRRVAELWAYCGYHVLCSNQKRPDAHSRLVGTDSERGGVDHHRCETRVGPVGVAPSRQRGRQSNWSITAKTRAYLVAESCIKQRTSPYRAVYDDGHTRYADSVHNTPCRRCGPSGKPAPVGSPLSAGHQHARAMRLVAKEILRGLWLESKAIHEEV